MDQFLQKHKQQNWILKTEQMKERYQETELVISKVPTKKKGLGADGFIGMFYLMFKELTAVHVKHLQNIYEKHCPTHSMRPALPRYQSDINTRKPYVNILYEYEYRCKYSQHNTSRIMNYTT